MKKLESLSNDFKDYTSLIKENQELRQEITSLKALTQNGIPVVTSGLITNEELTCIEQLQILKNHSRERELTFEECKKVDTYVKVLQVIRNKPKPEDDSAKDFGVDDLLKALNP